MRQRSPVRGRALWLSAAAAVTSAAHVVIDFAAGLYPTSLRGLLLVGLSAAALYVVWVIALVEMHKGSTDAVPAASILSLWQAGLANGLVVMVPCPPTVLLGGAASCPLAPWQDLAHVGSFVLGVGASRSVRRRGHVHIPAPS